MNISVSVMLVYLTTIHRLMGKPVGHTGIYTAKKMTCSIYANQEDLERARKRQKMAGERIRLQVMFANAILDHVEVGCK